MCQTSALNGMNLATIYTQFSLLFCTSFQAISQFQQDSLIVQSQDLVRIVLWGRSKARVSQTRVFLLPYSYVYDVSVRKSEISHRINAEISMKTALI